MIQRIQSLYLLLAGVFPAITFFFPVCILLGSNSWVTISSLGYDVVGVEEVAVRHPWGLMCCTAAAVIVAFVAIFKYKNRKVQLKWVYTALFLNIFWYLTLSSYVYSLLQRTSFSFSIEICSLLPLLSIIALILAGRAIRRDEAKVRAADRIR